MKKDKTRLATVLFVLGILLAGLANAAARKVIIEYSASSGAFPVLPFFSTLLFCLNLTIYLFLQVFWMSSVRHRLLPSRARNYLLLAACCAIAVLLLRSVKYRLVDDYAVDLIRAVWYLYYVPMILLPTLFLMTCIRIEGKNRRGRFDERLLLIPAAVMIALFLTNDLHHLAFRPNGDTVMTGANASYFNNVLFYIYYVYYGAEIIAGLILLIRANRRLKSVRKAVLPFVFLLVMLALVLVDKTLNWVRLPSMFTAPEIVSFCMLGIFESCVRNRLIPYNENYGGFFARMSFPAVITRRDLSAAQSSAEPITASSEELAASLEKPVYIDADTKLTGRRITAGYAFYTENEAELHRMNDRLAEANELIASENDLISAENELKARQAAVDSRGIIYSRITRKMLPYHRKALKMLDDMNVGDPDFNDKVARLNLLNVYIKRGTNLLLAGESGSEISRREFILALEESARYLGYCGIKASVTSDGDGMLDRGTALELYTAFYSLSEALLGSITMLHIALNGSRLRLIADCARPPELDLPVEITENDGLYFFGFASEEGGAL